MIEQIYLYLILTGATIGAVLAALWYQARTANRINLALIRLNEQCNFDTPSFLRKAWPLLEQAGLKGLTWQLDWFGVIVEGKSGSVEGHRTQREMHAGETKLAVTAYQHKQRGERRYFSETLIETFFLLLRTDMLIKANATDATFSQMSKLNLFLQHDMKNIAQFVQLMADQLASVPVGKEQKVLDYLSTAAPLVRQRADRIVRTLTAGQAHNVPLRTLHLREELEQLCRLHQLEYSISGSASIRVPENTIDSALDNILKNYNDLSLDQQDDKPVIRIAVTDNEQTVSLTIEADNFPRHAQLERLFEPFWTSNPAGLGIGLYQAKQMLEMCGGTLTARHTDAGLLQFLIDIPRHPAQP